MVGAPADGWAERGVEQAIRLLGGGSWEATTLHGTGGGMYGSSVARLRSGTDSAVAKVVLRNEAGPSDLASWRREFDLYRSDWLADALPDGLDLPACLASTVDDEAAVIVLEDVEFDDREARAVEWYGRLAQRLGRFNSAPVEVAPPWATHSFVRDEASRLVASVPSMARSTSPPVADLVAAWLPLLDRLVAALPSLLARLGACPHGFHHLDVFSRNAAEIGDRMVLIDWAYAGMAPIGADAASIVAINAMHCDIEPANVPDLYRSVVEGYLEGLAAAGRDHDPDDAEAVIEALLTLRWVGFIPQVHALGDRIGEVAEDVIGRPLEQVLPAWSAMTEFLMPLAERVVDSP